jgi:NAD-dependent deacetylase
MEEIEMRITEIADIFLDSNHAVVLTGAGVSTESGIPDFRSPGSGLWTVVNPELFTIQGFKANPGEFYRAGLPFYKMLQAAEPNAAHTVLAELEKRGLVKAIITQNVDSLHQKGGAKRVFEIHGTLSSVSCLHCGEGADLDQVIADVEEGLLPPLCIDCGEPLKPDVVLFGEPLSPDYKQALEEAQKADLILVVGSSMQVSPANQLPSYSDNLIIINRTPTFYDNQARVVIHESTARVMSLLLQELDGRQV